MKLTTKKRLESLDNYYCERYGTAQREAEDFCKDCPWRREYYSWLQAANVEDCPAAMDPMDYYCKNHEEYYEIVEYLADIDEKSTRLYAIMDREYDNENRKD